VVQRYSTLEEDGDLPYGSGCGGVIFILLERRATAAPLLEAMYAAWNAREPLAIATVLEGPQMGQRAFAATSPDVPAPLADSWQSELQLLALAGLEERRTRDERIVIDGEPVRVWVDYRAARPGLWIFGAGDDTRPLHRLARELGWFVAVADGRTHLATAGRFPAADIVVPLQIDELPGAAPAELDIHAGDAAVLATHSYEQDTHVLAYLLSRAQRPAYIGILGPQRRTREALTDAARLLEIAPTTQLVDDWLEEINGPTGLDLGADTPASIALSILAEIQKTITAASALPLKQVRAMRGADVG
jgi:xanthine/CO dehydrogenase XdhC/CoxF family maturation factor